MDDPQLGPEYYLVERFAEVAEKPSDITVVSSDGDDFALHCDRLSFKSPVFRDLLALGGQSNEPIKLTSAYERTKVLHIVFGMVYDLEDVEELKGQEDPHVLIDAFEGQNHLSSL